MLLSDVFDTVVGSDDGGDHGRRGRHHPGREGRERKERVRTGKGKSSATVDGCVHG